MSSFGPTLSGFTSNVEMIMEWYSCFTDGVFHYTTRWLGSYRTVLVASMIWWGFSLVFNSVSTFDTSESYALMRAIASKESWGVVYICVPILVAIGRLLDKPRVEQLAILLMALGWLFVATTFIHDNPWSTGSAMYSSMALLLLIDWRVKEIIHNYE